MDGDLSRDVVDLCACALLASSPGSLSPPPESEPGSALHQTAYSYGCTPESISAMLEILTLCSLLGRPSLYTWRKHSTVDFNRSEKSKQQLATSIEEFDPAKDVWRQLTTKGAPHPGLSAVACASFGGYLYAFGGFDGELLYCTLSRLELKTLTWSKLSAMDEDGPMRKDASGMCMSTAINWQ